MRLTFRFFCLLLLTLCASVSSFGVSAGSVPHFAWGADVGGATDMTGNDMSSINIDASFGYRSPFFLMAGIGAGMNIMVNNSNRSFPVYGILRTSFRSAPSPVFMDLRAGCAFNQVGDGQNQASLFVAPGIGFNLATSSKFRSYVILSYVFNNLHSYTYDNVSYDIRGGLHFACLRLGVSF